MISHICIYIYVYIILIVKCSLERALYNLFLHICWNPVTGLLFQAQELCAWTQLCPSSMGQDGQTFLSRRRTIYVRCRELSDVFFACKIHSWWVQPSIQVLYPCSHFSEQFVPESTEAHKPKSYFDVAPKLYEANPPPGTYDAKGSRGRWPSSCWWLASPARLRGVQGGWPSSIPLWKRHKLRE